MSSMSLTRFTEILDAYGANEQRWPIVERDLALQLLQSSEAARALQVQAAELDQGLDSWVLAAPSANLQAQVIASFVPKKSGWRSVLAEFWRDIGGWRMAGPAFAASLAIGAVVPFWLDDGSTDLPEEDLIAAVQMVEDFSEIGP